MADQTSEVIRFIWARYPELGIKEIRKCMAAATDWSDLDAPDKDLLTFTLDGCPELSGGAVRKCVDAIRAWVAGELEKAA